MKAKGCLHPITCDRVDRKENVGHWVAWPDEVKEEEEAKWLAEPLVPFRHRKFGKVFLVWGQKLAGKDVGLQPKAPGGPVKSIEQNLWTVVRRKAGPADSGEMSLVRKRKEHEK